MKNLSLTGDNNRLEVWIDTESFEKCLQESRRKANAILNFEDSELIALIRTPEGTEIDELDEINQYELVHENGQIEGINITNESGGWRDIAISTNQVQNICDRAFPDDSYSISNYNKVIPIVFQHDSFYWDDGTQMIYLTEDRDILSIRHKISNPLGQEGSYNIMSLEEASIFMDLFLKIHGAYRIMSRYHINSEGWYEYSTKAKIPSLQDEGKITQALKQRFKYLLKSLDRMGMLYYAEPTFDNMFSTLYHFNQLITLITGIFDNLALKTAERYDLEDFDKIQISLNNNRKGFLDKIEGVNEALREHIEETRDFINIIYDFRELVVHREGLTRVNFQYVDYPENWNKNMIKINKRPQGETIGRCGDEEHPYEPFTKWGVYSKHNDYFLEPYHFAKQAVCLLTHFAEQYLQLLGYFPNLEKRMQEEDSFKLFVENNLGF